MPLDTISVLPVLPGWRRCASLSLGWRRCATLCYMERTCATQPRSSHLGEVLPLCAAPPWDPKWLICATPSHPPGAYAPWLPPCANALGMSTWRICARWSVWSSHAGRYMLRGHQRDPLVPTLQTGGVILVYPHVHREGRGLSKGGAVTGSPGRSSEWGPLKLTCAKVAHVSFF